MHIDPSTSSSADDLGTVDTRPWYKQLTRYHWFVLVVAALGWLFDCLDQQLFILARPAAMRELIPESSYSDAKSLDIARRQAGDYATSIFIAGWATGGLFFGMLGDRIGRAKTMVITILLYSLFTGLSSFSQGVWDFSFYRFLTGLGVGGEFAVGVSLVAEVMPTRARPYTLGLLQALSAIGNVSAAFINLGLGVAEEQGLVTSPWRIMFLIGAVPALLALVIRRNLKEPETWQKASHSGAAKKQLGSYADLFRDPKLRKHALLGLVLGCAGVVGLWSVGFFTPDLIRFVQRKQMATQVYNEQLAIAKSENDSARIIHIETLLASVDNPDAASKFDEATKKEQGSLEGMINGRLSRWGSYASIAINIGAFFGMFGFGALSQKIGRRPTFALALIAAFISTTCVFWYLKDFWQIWVMVPVMGFCQLSLFAGYAIYFPELFPTRLRSTGTSFCYNVGRFVAAFGPLVKAQLEKGFADTAEPLRYAGVTMSLVFLIGLFVLPFLPETMNKPLPE
ncbi:MFS transporter [Planctomicrobium sp. SH661]|uniref:MFS transporter n=1 Tax=Planctomicrobium sp. SH661 TaxID=3448124 RepID=UPI003F5B6D78